MIDTSTSSRPKLPVTILSGFLGSGKTTLLQHILTSSKNNKKYAIIVNDMSELNIDSLLKPFAQHQGEQLVEMSNGCICCTLREDLLNEIKRLGKESKYDHLIIESTGISEPMAVAETFAFETEPGNGITSETLMDYADIDSMVTVVDAVNFMYDMKNVEDLKDRNLQANEKDTRTITDLLIAQVEFASVVLLNKCDLLPFASDRDEVKAWIRSLNHDAMIIETVRSNVTIDDIIGAKTYDYDKVSQSAAWIQAMNTPESDRRQKKSETDEYGVSSIIYEARKPFHPKRLMHFINEAFPVKSAEPVTSTDSHDQTYDKQDKDILKIDVGSSQLLRSKGFFWLANDPTHMYIWSQAGGLFQLSRGGKWWVDVPIEDWPKDEEDIRNINSDFDGEHGDRRQELVFIGTLMEEEKIIHALNACLLTDCEMAGGQDVWKKFENPFPESSYKDNGIHTNSL